MIEGELTMLSTKIVDMFTYFNEIHLLELRLLVLKDVVDYFIISEMSVTHAGLEKGFNLENHIDQLPVSRDRIIYLKVDDAPIVDATLESERRKLEFWQRNALARGIAELNLAPDDVVMLSDLDEIPDPQAVIFALGALEHYETAIFCHLHRKFFINAIADNYSVNQCWLGTVATRADTLTRICPEDLRRGGAFPRAAFLWTVGRAEKACYIEPGGWHLTYFGGGASADLKAQSIADGMKAHVATDFFLPPLSKHNWTSGRTEPVMAWRNALDATVLPAAPFSMGELTYLPEPVVKDPQRWEWLWWYDSVIDASLPSTEAGGR